MIDAMVATIVDALPAENRGPVPSAMHLVQNVEHYLDMAGSRPVHISEICAEFNVSRRSLHRAFYDMLGLGPVTFLRRKRLCAIHSALRENTPATATIGEIAMNTASSNSTASRTITDRCSGNIHRKRCMRRNTARAIEHRKILAIG